MTYFLSLFYKRRLIKKHNNSTPYASFRLSVDQYSPATTGSLQGYKSGNYTPPPKTAIPETLEKRGRQDLEPNGGRCKVWIEDHLLFQTDHNYYKFLTYYVPIGATRLHPIIGGNAKTAIPLWHVLRRYNFKLIFSPRGSNFDALTACRRHFAAHLCSHHVTEGLHPQKEFWPLSPVGDGDQIWRSCAYA